MSPARSGVVDVVVDVGDAVGEADDLPLQGGRQRVAGVMADAVAHLPGEVEPPAVVLHHLDHPGALLVVREDPGAQAPRRTSRMTFSPAWPKGVCPRSWPSAMASVRSSLSRSARAMLRAMPATSRV